MIVANWKMHGSRQAVSSWISTVSEHLDFKDPKLCIFCPPSCYLEYAGKLLNEENSQIKLGSQIVNESEAKPLTGGITAAMLKDIGADYVLIGHSEQRSFIRDGDTGIAKKIKESIDDGVIPIFCVGEDLAKKNNNETESFISSQLEVLQILSESQLSSVIVAYEPIWAIGTGLNADRQYIEKIHGFIKQYLKDLCGVDIYVPVLYGGSVKLENCEEIISSDEVDGLLIGGASLDPEIFSNIFNLS